MDNILGNINTNTITIEDFSEKISNIVEVGDIIEFGTCTGTSAIELAKKNSNRKIFTIDHFQGLEQTKKPVWNAAGWTEGAFRIGGEKGSHLKWHPKTIQEVKDAMSIYDNIILIEEDIHKLKSPDSYSILNNIVACHIDVDIYEPTVSSLKFLEKCIWDKIFIRFDDWHGHKEVFDHHERLAFKEWIEETKYEYKIPFGGHAGGVKVYR